MGVKIAIVGMSESAKDAPWDDPSWQKWGLANDVANFARFDAHFEIHDMKLLEGHYGGRLDDYLERLEECDNLYMQDRYLPNAIRYPFGLVEPYLQSSVAHMFALAMTMADAISLYGVDMKAEGEYAYQKPNMEYLIGLARGRGIEVLIHESSPLCKNPNVRYGHGAFHIL
jgi:hypothetical protein